MANWYCSSAAWTAVTAYANTTAYTLGQIRRQLATPTVGNERVFRCTTAGTSGGSEPAWNLGTNATTTAGTAVFTECTGQETYQGTSWAAPLARLRTAISKAAVGDTIFVGSNHAATEAATVTYNPASAGTLAIPLKIICVALPSSAIPPVQVDMTTGASETVTGTNNMTFEVFSAQVYGITFNVGTGTSAVTLNFHTGNATVQAALFESCSFSIPVTTATNNIVLGPGNINSTILWRNTNLSLSSAASRFNSRASYFEWNGGTLTLPNGLTALFGNPTASTHMGGATLRGIDLSAMTSSSVLVDAATTCGPTEFNFFNCRLRANPGTDSVFSNFFTAPRAPDINTVSSGSGTDVAQEEHNRYEGVAFGNVANYRVGGNTNGVAPSSWLVFSYNTGSFVVPMESPDIFQWLTSPGTHTVTVYIANGNGVSLTNKEVWFDVEYLGVSSRTRSLLATTFPGLLATAAPLTTDTSTWITDQVSLTKQRLAVTFTTTVTGLVRIRVKLRRDNFGIYVDPGVVVS